VLGLLALEDGTIFRGRGFAAEGMQAGEAVFNTSMTGYQEILTDPSYRSQIITMTYPLIGNYGINEHDVESDRVQVSGFVVKEACNYPSNFTSQKTLQQYLIENNTVGIERIDTRAVTKHLRKAGAMKAVIAAGASIDEQQCVQMARDWEGLVGIDTVQKVSCEKIYEFNPDAASQKQFHVVAYDFGIKTNILRILDRLGCRITVVPAKTPAEQVLAMQPDGIFLSNGPGDPAAVTYAVEQIKALVGQKPLFGICLGHQLLSQALGGSTYKLKFGHRGANHPAKNQQRSSVEITSQNHGFCVDIESLKQAGVEVSHVNLNDHTCEGIFISSKKLLSVQYHPEASPGPHDSQYIFNDFIELMKVAS